MTAQPGPGSPHPSTRDTPGGVRVIVLAKAPVAGRAKTRLGADIGLSEAAAVAAASLLDTLAACTEAVGASSCHLALEGDLADAVRGDELTAAIAGWTVTPQRGDDLGERIAAAHDDVVATLRAGSSVDRDGLGPQEGITVQIGMDTPQVTPGLLLDAARSVTGDRASGALGPAEDGGWWVLALRDPARAAALVGVPMSTATTYLDTRDALVASGVAMAELGTLRDVDTVADADTVAGEVDSDSEFARAWAQVTTRTQTCSGATR